ncbi:MAG: uracil-DNA glycosylase [Verrucomicrobiota bacterium]
MSDDYQRLLTATIDHLEILKGRGTNYVTVDFATVASLSQPARFAPAVSRQEVKSSPQIEKVSAPAQPEITTPQPKISVGTSEKQAAMSELKSRAMICVKCPNLAASRKNVVFGVGDIESPLMFVGEAPGADEDAQGEPFVGKAGELLTRIIQTMGFTRETIYIANVLKCRPDMPGQSSGNRKPTTDEMNTCLPYLLEQIDIIKPRVIVALGATAVEGLFGKPLPITKLRGNWQTFRDTPVMPTFHPAYLLHNQALSEKRKVWEDMLQVLEKLEAPISEKQRNYFLKA